MIFFCCKQAQSHKPHKVYKVSEHIHIKAKPRWDERLTDLLTVCLTKHKHQSSRTQLIK